jgi:hypothetical protein
VRDSERQKERHRVREKDRERQRQAGRERQRGRERDRERMRNRLYSSQAIFGLCGSKSFWRDKGFQNERPSERINQREGVFSLSPKFLCFSHIFCISEMADRDRDRDEIEQKQRQSLT